jgi:hypothetical protein
MMRAANGLELQIAKLRHAVGVIGRISKVDRTSTRCARAQPRGVSPFQLGPLFCPCRGVSFPNRK